MPPRPRVLYDTIAHLYDRQPYREKTVDPELLAFVAQRAPLAALSMLDIGCGTGNQVVANRTAVPHARWVGVDRSLGMLRQAQPKAPDLTWIQADSAALPLPAQRFDFVTCQYAFHHMLDKAGMLREVLRVLRPGGRFVLSNICPQDMADWLYYQYFPEAQALDQEDFWPPEVILAAMAAVGFTKVTEERQHLRYEQDLRLWLAMVQRRETCSQLLTIPDAAYAAGVRRLEDELASALSPLVRMDHLCVVSIRGEKQVDAA